MRKLTYCPSASALSTATDPIINMGSPSAGNGASPSAIHTNHNTTSAPRAAVKPTRLARILCRVLGQVPKPNRSTDTYSSHWDTVPDAFLDSGVGFENKNLSGKMDETMPLGAVLTSLDGVKEGGHWDESFLESFDNEHHTFIDTEEKLIAFLPTLLKLKDSTPEAPELSCDSEGCRLGRYGSLTIFQMRVRSMKHTYVFDVLALGGRAMFEMKGDHGQSLKSVLEFEQTKVFWDVRQDSDAMFHHFSIRLGGVVDAQLMELASRRTPDRNKLSSLFTAVSVDWKAWMVGDDFWDWKRSFREAKDYFNESNYECFNVRPLTHQALEYSAGDVDCIEKLYDIYLPRMNEKFWTFVRRETQARIDLSLLEEMPEGSNLAPTSISTIPYEWPPLVDRWPTLLNALDDINISTARVRLIATTNTLGTSKEYNPVTQER